MEEKKKSNKGLIVLVVILIVISLGAITYICYDKGVFDKSVGEDEEVKKEEKSIQDYKIVYTEDGKEELLIIKKDNNWQEYDSYTSEAGGKGFSIFGEKDGKLYYSVNRSIKYIDFENDNNEPQVLVSANGKECSNNISQGSIVNEKLYFTLSTNCTGAKLVSLDINETDINKAKTIVDNVSNYEIKNNIIYYNLGWNCADYVLYKKDIDTEKTTKIGKGICEFSIKNDNILYFMDKDHYDYESKKRITSDETGFYNYDINTDESKKIDNIEIYYGKDDDGDYIEGTIYKNDVYYIESNKLIKNHDGENETLYVYKNSDEDELNIYVIKNPIVIKDNVVMVTEMLLHPSDDEDIKYEVGEEELKIIIDSKMYSEKDARSILDLYSVKMIDGSTKNFSILDTIEY